MSDLADTELSHRNRLRIKTLGEVFTPELYVDQMLDLLGDDKSPIWHDENVIFFEPTVGNGNIILPIFRRRLEAFYRSAQTKSREDRAFYAVANALNSIWALDIDERNVFGCRSRILKATCAFMRHKFNSETDNELFQRKNDFLAHVICAIKWHFRVNESLSALSNPKEASESASLTALGEAWHQKYGHRPIDFELTWVEFFRSFKDMVRQPHQFKKVKNELSKIECDGSNYLEGYEKVDFNINTMSATDRRRSVAS